MQLISSPQPPQIIGGTTIPYPFEVWADGVYARRSTDGEGPAESPEPEIPSEVRRCPYSRRRYLEQVTLGPIWIVDSGTTVETQEAWTRLAWADARTGHLVVRWYPREDWLSPRKLARLAAYGAPVSESRARAVSAYLEQVEHANAGAPHYYLTDRSGYIETPNGIGWQIGPDWIGPEGTLSDALPSTHPVVLRGLTSKGPTSTWLDKFVEIWSECPPRAKPVFRWLTFSSFAAPLLRLAFWRTFLVYHYGETGVGKSATANFGIAAWGQPKVYSLSFNGTLIGLQETFRHIDDLPVVFDELQASSFKDNAPKIAQLLYMLVLGKSRLRSGKTGGLAGDFYNYRSVIRMTGEQPLIGNDVVDLGGLNNRTIQIDLPSLGPGMSKPLNDWLDRQKVYGQPGRDFLKWLVPRVNDPKKREMFGELAQDILQRVYAQTNKDDQRVAHLAIAAFGQTLANRALLGSDWSSASCGAIQDAIFIANALEFKSNRSFADQALDYLRTHIASHRGRYVDARDQADIARLRMGGVNGLVGILRPRANESIWYVPSEIDRVLKAGGFNAGRFWRDMRRSGRLVTGEGGRVTVRRQISGWNAYVRSIKINQGLDNAIENAQGRRS